MEPVGDERLQRWERATAGVLTGLAVLFIVAYAVPIMRPDLPRPWLQACNVASFVIWLTFGADYAIRLWLTENRRRFVRSHLFDLIVLVLPVLRPLRMLRLVTALLVINRRTESWTRGRLALYVGCTTVLLIIVGALGPHSS